MLFLDELPEFDRRVLESLRQPLESGSIELSRAAGKVCYPARFQLIAAMNPCPAGRTCTASDCICTVDQQRRYQSRVSGPLLDRIDLRVLVPPVGSDVLLAPSAAAADPAEIRARVAAALHAQLARAGKLNSSLSAPEVDAYCVLDRAGRLLVGRAMERLGLSARGTHRVLKVARTLADLVGAAQITTPHLTEALAFREVAVGY